MRSAKRAGEIKRSPAEESQAANDLAAYFCATIVDARPRYGVMILDRVEYVIDAAVGWSALFLVALVAIALRLNPAHAREYLSASGYLVFAVALLLLWPPMDWLNLWKLRQFDPSIVRISPAAFVVLYAACIVILVSHHVRDQTKPLLVGIAGVVAAAANAVAWAKPAMLSQVLQMPTLANFFIFAICSLLAAAALGAVFWFAFAEQQAPPADAGD